MIDKLERKMVAYNVLSDMVFRYPPFQPIMSQFQRIQRSDARRSSSISKPESWEPSLAFRPGVDWSGLQRPDHHRNGSVQQPNNAFWGKEGKWLVENHGADPDILLDNDPASVMAGKDAQLDKAIEIAMQKITEQPFSFPPQPPYPSK
jgi:tricorn protease